MSSTTITDTPSLPQIYTCIFTRYMCKNRKSPPLAKNGDFEKEVKPTENKVDTLIKSVDTCPAEMNKKMK